MYLRTKQLASFIAVALLPLVIVSLVGYTLVRTLLVERVTEETTAFVGSIAQEKLDDIAHFSSLVRQTAEYPPIQGIIRAEETGVDSTDESTSTQWKDRLAQLFESTVRNSNGLVRQVRFIDENGQELVNVTQKNGVVHRVGESELQNKATNDYFDETMRLSPWSIYVSPIELNKEHGEYEIPYVPVMRIATPVVDERDSSRKGIVIMNLLANEVFANTYVEGSPITKFFLVDAGGKYVYHPDENRALQSFLDENAPTFIDEQPEFAKNVETHEAFSYRDAQSKELRVWRKIRYAPQAPDRYYVLVAAIDETLLLAPVTALDRSMLLVAAAVLLVSVFLSAYLSRSLTLPILRLKTTVGKIARGDFNERSEINDGSEIGELAQDVNRMAAELSDSYADLERRVKQRTAELRAVIDNVPIGIYLVDAGKGVINLANDRAKRLFNDALSADRPYLTIAGRIYLREDGTPYPIEKLPSVRALESGGVHRADDVFVRDQDGSLHNLLKIAAGIGKKGEVTGVIVAAYDRTKEYEIDRKKDEFVSFAAHQLKTPSQSIMWLVQGLLGDGKKAPKLTKRQREDLREIEGVSGNMLKTVQRFLDISRLELDTYRVEPRQTKVRDVVDDVIETHEQAIEKKRIKATVKASKRMAVTADRGLLKTVLDNLVSNAVKYTPESGRVRIEAVQDGKGTWISVTDTGIGIPDVDKKGMFEKMHRASNVGEIDGTGFGLYLAKELMRKTGGDLTFVSEVGKGSTFTVWLPPEGMHPKQGSSRIS